MPGLQSIYGNVNHGYTYRRNYLAMVKGVDESIGSVIESLKQQGMYNNTVLVFSSDNGGVIEAGAYARASAMQCLPVQPSQSLRNHHAPHGDHDV